eukprot:gene10428-24293_t
MWPTDESCQHRFPYGWEDVVRAQAAMKMRPADSAVRIELIDDGDGARFLNQD